MVTFSKDMDSRLHIRMNPQCWALKDIRSNKIYNNGIAAQHLLQEISRYFQPKDVSTKMALTKFHTDHKFGLFMDLRSMAPRLSC